MDKNKDSREAISAFRMHIKLFEDITEYASKKDPEMAKIIVNICYVSRLADGQFRPEKSFCEKLVVQLLSVHLEMRKFLGKDYDDFPDSAQLKTFYRNGLPTNLNTIRSTFALICYLLACYLAMPLKNDATK